MRTKKLKTNSHATVALMFLPLATPLVALGGPHPCSQLADDCQRLACYDAAFGRGGTATDTSPLAATSTSIGSAAAAAQVVAKSPEENFGLSDSARRARDGEEGPQQIEAVIAAIALRPTGESVITLQDGQVWEQLGTDVTGRLRAGDAVTIRKAALGSFLLVGPDRNSLRVRRLR
ncbi:MAG: hypothetical protein ACR2I8_05430 [Steroidobacteraceae bacterium]